MKKYLIFLLTLWIPMMVWAQTSTHTLTIEVGTTSCKLRVKNINNKSFNETVVKKDTIYIVNYQIEEGEPFIIQINPEQNYYESGNVYSEFTAWMRDGAVYSTSPELRLTMGKSDIYLTAVMTRKLSMPYSPGANWFDASTGVLTLDEIRAGSISNAFSVAKTRYNFERNDVLSIVAVGALNSSVSLQDFYDFTVTGESSSNKHFNNLLLIDLSQTSGMSILATFEGNEDYQPKLEHIVLGPGLDSVAGGALQHHKINTIDCYAVTPPHCAARAFGYMTVPQNDVLVRVPHESVELYKQATGWKDFPNIQPLYETSNITVKLPSDVPEGYYEDMTVELSNLRSQFVQNRKVLNKREILFGGQVRGGEYQAVLKNAYGQVMGQSASAELGEEDIKLTIDNLLRSKDVSLKVNTPEGKDITDKVRVLWTDESDKALGYASRLKAVAEGTKLTYSIILMNELAKQYITPSALQYTVNGGGENLLAIHLEPIQQLTLHGQVKDKQTGDNIPDATVALTLQQGENHQSITATTDADGKYELQGTNQQGELSVTAPGYLPKTVAMIAPSADGALPSVEMEPFNGVIVHTWFTYTEAALVGTEGKTTDGYKAYPDVAWQVYNQTKSTAIKDFIIKDYKLYFPSDVEMGDELTVTASSHNNNFNPVSASCEIANSGLGYVTLPIVQKGGLKAEANLDESSSVMGILYDANGRFVRSNTYKFDGLSFSNLASGDYTLVSMTSNTLMRRLLLLSTLDDMGLAEGTDYVKNAVHIEDGKIISVNVSNVPALDMEKLHFTDSKTYFIANQNVINVGQSVVVKSKLSFAEQYAGRVGNVELVLDMPDGIDLVENSALTGSTVCNYRIEDGRYIFSSENNGNDLLALCLSPKLAGEFRITGSVRFTLDGVQMIQPIGTVWVQAKGFTLNSPFFITPSTLRVYGAAPTIFAGEKIEVYDGDELVGNVRTDASGCWAVNIQISSTGSNDIHAIKARLTTQDTGVLETEVKYVVYSDNYKIANKVVMLTPKKDPVIFNYFENTVSPKNYTYILKGWWHENIPYSTTFTFFAYFDGELDASKIKNVQISVLASDGTTRTLDAEYDIRQQCYYASSDYPNSAKLPISAYAYAEGIYTPISEEEQAALDEEEARTLEKLTQIAISAAEKKGKIEVLPDDGETLNLRYTVSGKAPLAFTMKEMDYDEASAYVLENGLFVYRGDKGNMIFTFVNGIDEAEMILIDVDEHYALRTIITEAEIDDWGAQSNKKQVAPQKKGKGGWAVMGKAANLGSSLLSYLGIEDYLDLPQHKSRMENRKKKLSKAMRDEVKQMNHMLDMKCGGKYSMLPGEKKSGYNRRMNEFKYAGNKLLDELDEASDNFMADLYRRMAFDVGSALLTKGCGKAIVNGAASKLSPKALAVLEDIQAGLKTADGKSFASQIGFLDDLVKSGQLDGLPSLAEALSIDFDRNYNDFLNKYDIQGKSIMRGFYDLHQEMLDNLRECDELNPCEVYDCDKDYDDDDEDDDEDDDDFLDKEPKPEPKPHPKPAKPLIDPSGYVYEAVPSNRVEGATATIYYKDFMLNQNGNSTGENDVLWDAENYDQENPQITDATGMFQWDVPQGIWQVRVQKEGYENNISEWLPVPPPQLDVNIPLVRNRLPKVEKAHAYEDAVAVKFDTYMIPALLTTDLITITQNGNAVEGTIELTDEEEAPDGAAYASRLRFVPSTPFTASEVTLFISGQVQNYSGIEMDEPFEAVLPIEREVKNLVADKKAKVAYGSTGSIHVKAEPAAAAAGKTVLIQCASGIIASAVQTAVVLNEKGEADVTIQGDLPGDEIVTFTLQEAELTASTLVKVVMPSNDFQVDAPEASIPSETEVDKGTEITLSCKTEGASIYYTLDGSSPVDSGTRILYDGKPIVINEETTLTVVAVVEGIGMSEVRIYHYTVHNNQKIEVVNSNRHAGNVQKYIVNGQLIILRDGKTFTVLGAEVK